jgi:hypothetical protein
VHFLSVSNNKPTTRGQPVTRNRRLCLLQSILMHASDFVDRPPYGYNILTFRSILPNCRYVNPGLHVLATLLALISLVSSVRAQVATTGKITGIVTDPSGAVLANATVTANSPALFAKRTTTTHADGSYLLDLFPPGAYDVTVSPTGFRAFTQTGIVLTADSRRRSVQGFRSVK